MHTSQWNIPMERSFWEHKEVPKQNAALYPVRTVCILIETGGAPNGIFQALWDVPLAKLKTELHQDSNNQPYESFSWMKIAFGFLIFVLQFILFCPWRKIFQYGKFIINFTPSKLLVQLWLSLFFEMTNIITISTVSKWGTGFHF